MSKELPFIILCIEEYKNRKGLEGNEVVELFNRYAVFDYLRSFYESLHTMGMNYVIDDIDEYIKTKQTA